MYENFNASSQESLDSISNRLQKIVSQLAILGENISQEDLNLKLLRSLSSEWSMHVVVWGNKPDLGTISFDDLYNNFKIVEQEVKRSVTSSSNSSSYNVAFVSTPGSTNEDNTANVQFSIASTKISTASTNDSTASLSDATIYAFLANQPNGSHPRVVHRTTRQINEDDLEEIDLKIGPRNQESKPRNQESMPKNQESSKRTVNLKEEVPAQLATYGLYSRLRGLFAPLTIDLSSSGLNEFQQPKFEGYEVNVNKSVSENSSNEIKKTTGAPIIEDWVFDCDEDDLKVMLIPQVALKDKGIFDSGVSSIDRGNKSYPHR
ncbi:hypothetical protein Tco_0821709 [Tanacetum coccineum]|uniref:Uncharacterized protein n=1 Tax=Tanacetum coccineum TaxID=301880 RepID=A0ABQ5AD25_9ASTR